MNPANIGRLCLLAVFVFAAADYVLQGDTVYCAAVIDGDTIRLEDGETVRLIGIDAKDKYNRLLRFVYIGNLCINEEMIRQGNSDQN